MTFRTRVAAAIAVVVAVAVLLACAVAYKAARDALVGSTDSSLTFTYQGLDDHGIYPPQLQLVNEPGVGILLWNNHYGPMFDSAFSGSAIDSTIRRASTTAGPAQLRTVSDSQGNALRELVVTIPAGTDVIDFVHHQTFPLTQPAALVLVEPFQGVESRLRSLGEDLLLLAAFGVLVAALFGWLAARASLIPLAKTTKEIEDVATTLDVSHRVDEGKDDELGRLRRAFNKLLEQVERSQDAQRLLILDASHELRTPLTSLRANAQVLGRIDELDHDDVTQLSDDMVSQVDELTSLVGDLTELTRGEHSVEEPTSFNLADVVTECTEIAETHARTRRVTIELQAEDCEVHAKRNRVARAVGNLLDNAIKFSPSGGTVDVTCRAGEVTVEDEGHGIAVEDLPRVFDRFFRSSRDRGLPGSGLGLAIVAQVATEAGGSVDASNSPSRGGAKLTLHLPSR